VSYRASLLLLVVVSLVGIVVSSAWRASSGALFDQVGSSILTGVVIFGGGMASFFLRKQRESRDCSDASDSVEAHAAKDAQAKVFFDGIVGGAAIAAVVGILGLSIHPSIPLLVWIAALVIDFWIRFAIGKRQLVAANEE